MGPQFVKQQMLNRGIPVLKVDGDLIWITDRLVIYINPGMRLSIMQSSPALPRTKWTRLAEERDIHGLAEVLMTFIKIGKDAPKRHSAQILDLQALRAKKAASDC